MLAIAAIYLQIKREKEGIAYLKNVRKLNEKLKDPRVSEALKALMKKYAVE